MKSERRKKAPSNKRRLSDALLRNLKGKDRTYLVWDDRQGGFGVAVTPNGTISFKVTYYVKNRLRWYTLDKYPSIGLKDARELAQKIRAKAVLGEDAMAQKVNARQGETLKSVSEQYVERCSKQKNKSWRQADNLMKRYVLPKLGSRLVKDITHQDIRNLFNSLTIDKQRPVVANQSLAAVSAVLKWALEWKMVEENVARGIERNKVKAEERFLTDAELALMWLLLDDPLRLILVTGQRPGEVAKMRWEDIDLNEKLWTLPGDPVGDWPGTKNARTHEVPLSEQTISILNELGPRENGPVFNGRIPKTIPIWKALGLPRFRPHHLRATCATGLDRLGINRENISRVLNHTEGGVTAGYIRHDAIEQKRMALDAWGAHLTAVVEGRPVPSTVVDFRTAR